MDNEKDLSFELAKERTLLARERTRFSAERTVSSWMRTGLASVGAGFAIVRLIEFQGQTHRLLAKVIGEVLIAWGIAVLILSLIDYKKSCKKLEAQVDSSNELWIGLTVLVFVVVSLFLFIVAL